jgi:ribosome-binding protein aMBF1 (putative translation factor)
MVIIKKIFLNRKWRYAKMKGQIEQKDIAFILKKLRKDSGLTQQDLADKLFCDIRQIRRYETEGTEKLSVINLYASIFNISSIGILSASASLGAF